MCLPLSLPSEPKTQHVLYKLLPERSDMDPPTRVICKLRATSDIIEYEGAASPPASMSSAYSGKLSFEYGPFHISYKNKTRKLQQVKGNTKTSTCAFLATWSYMRRWSKLWNQNYTWASGSTLNHVAKNEENSYYGSKGKNCSRRK